MLDLLLGCDFLSEPEWLKLFDHLVVHWNQVHLLEAFVVALFYLEFFLTPSWKRFLANFELHFHFFYRREHS